MRKIIINFVSSSDPLHTCTLDARHRCEKVCHEGACGPCNGTTTLTCRCLSMDKEFKCSEIGECTSCTRIVQLVNRKRV